MKEAFSRRFVSLLVAQFLWEVLEHEAGLYYFITDFDYAIASKDLHAL